MVWWDKPVPVMVGSNTVHHVTRPRYEKATWVAIIIGVVCLIAGGAGIGS